MNNKYYEPWNERTIKFQRKDDYPYVPFGEERIKFNYGSFVEHVFWWAVIAVGVWLWFRA